MERKPKLTFSNYDKETGMSYAIVAGRYGEFLGKSRLDPADKEFESKYAGCEYAEIRANISYMKEKLKIARIKLKTMQDYYNIIKGMNDFNEKSIEAKKARYLIFQYSDEVETLKNQIKSSQNHLKDKIIFRDKILKEVKRKKNMVKNE